MHTIAELAIVSSFPIALIAALLLLMYWVDLFRYIYVIQVVKKCLGTGASFVLTFEGKANDFLR